MNMINIILFPFKVLIGLAIWLYIVIATKNTEITVDEKIE